MPDKQSGEIKEDGFVNPDKAVLNLLSKSRVDLSTGPMAYSVDALIIKTKKQD